MGDNIQKEKQEQQSKQVYSFINDRQLSQHWYLKIMPIIIGNNYSVIILKTIVSVITSIVSLHYSSFYNGNGPTDNFRVFQISLSRLTNKQVSQLLITITLTLQFYVLQNIILHHIKKEQRIPIVSSINQYIDKYLFVIVQLNILLAFLSFLHESIFIIKIISFSIASLTAVFSDYFLMPKNNPHDFLYSIESSFIILFRCSFLISMSFSLMEYYKISSFGSAIVSFILIIILNYQFYGIGALVYRNKTSSLCFSASYALFMAVNITMLLKLFIATPSWTSITLFALFLIKIDFTSKSLYKYPNLRQQIDLNSLKALTEISMRMHEEFSEEARCLLIGLIQIHRKNCLGKNCISKSLSTNSQYLKTLSSNSLADQQMEKNIFYFNKCLFEGLINKDNNDAQTLISYCEYLLHANKMMLPLIIIIERLQQHKLSISQQIRLQNIKDTIKEQLNKQNQIIQPKFILEEVIALENIYLTLKEAAHKIINKNIEIWHSFKGFVSQAQVVQRIQQIIDIKKIIKANLMNSKNFNRHHGLKRLISFFKLYLNNDLKKQKQIQALSSRLIIPQKEGQFNEYLAASYPLQTLIAVQDCFSPYSIVILVKFSLQKTLIIQKVSKSVTNLLGYDENELNQVELSAILPVYLKQKHSRMMVSLIEEGFTSNQKSLKVVSTQCLKKDNTLVSACKSFKIYADVYGQVRFACILKVDPIQPIIIISNSQNIVLQNSANLQEFIEHHTKESFSHFLENIINLRTNKCQFQQSFQQTTINNKQLKFKARKIEYDSLQPILCTIILYPKQSYNTQSISMSTQAIRYNIQTQFQQKKEYFPNIFMKEENFIPVQNLPAIKNTKTFLYILGVVYLTFPISFAFVSQYNCQNVLEYFEMKVYFINLLKQPYQLGIFYFQIQMNLEDDIQRINDKLNIHRSKYIQDFLDPIVLKTVFDKSLFEDMSIEIENQSVNGPQLLSLDSKDVFFSIGSFISSYSNDDRQLNSQQFNKFNRLMMPFYDELQNIKNRLFKSYSQTFQFISIPDIVFVSIMAGLFVFSVIIICINLYRLQTTWSNLTKLISNPTKQEYTKSVTYWQSLRIILSPEQPQANLMLFSKSQEVAQQVNERRNEDFNMTKRQVSKLLPIGIIPIATILAAICVIQYLKFIEIDTIRQFQSNGAVFLDGYPSCIVFSYCLLQRHYNQTVLNLKGYEQQSFEEVLQEFQQFQEIQYLAQHHQENSQFYSLYKNYFFSNPCDNIPIQSQIQGYTNQKCSKYAEGYLTNGILAYERYTSQLIQNAIEDSAIFQQEQLNNLIESLILVNSLIEQMLRVWSIQFHNRIQNLIRNTIILNSIATVVSIIIYYYFIYGKFMSNITELQRKYKQVYSMLMSKQRIQKDKIAQSQLILCGFLQKK